MNARQITIVRVDGEKYIRLQDALDMLRGIALDMGVEGYAQVAKAFNETANHLESSTAK